MKKVVVLLFAAVMGQMVAASDVDLYRVLLGTETNGLCLIAVTSLDK